MPLNPDAVGAVGDVRTISWNSKDALLYAVGIGAGQIELAVHDREHQGHRAGGVPDVRRRRRVGHRVAGQELDERDRHVQPGAARARLAGDHAAPADPGRGQGDHAGQGRGDVRQGQGRRRVHRGRGQARVGRAAVDHPLVGVHPRRGRLGRRPRPVGPAERAARRRGARSRDHACRRRPTRPSSTACRATATRCTPTRRSPRWAASTGRSCTACAPTASPAGRCCSALCGNDVTKFHHIEGRFSSPVMPGDALTVRAWRLGDGEAVFTTSVGDRTVIDQGLVRFS